MTYKYYILYETGVITPVHSEKQLNINDFNMKDLGYNTDDDIYMMNISNDFFLIMRSERNDVFKSNMSPLKTNKSIKTIFS